VFEKFTERGRKLMSLSRQEAVRLGSDSIGTEHLLLGLLLGTGSSALKVLKNLNLDPGLIRRQVEERLPAPTSSAPTLGQLPLAPGCKRVIELAGNAAAEFGHDVIGTEHLLVGLFDEGHGIAAEVLTGLGLERLVLRAMILEVLADETPRRPDPEDLEDPFHDRDLRRRALGYRALTDRPSVQEPLVKLMERGRSIALVGPKRVGKTSIVLAMSRAKAGTCTYWSVDHRMFDEFHGGKLSTIRRPGRVSFIAQGELLTASRSVNANLLEDRMQGGERLILEFRDGGLEAFSARYPQLAKDLVRVEVKAPDAAECRELLQSARLRLQETSTLDISDEVLEEADRLARDRWRLVAPPWPTVIALWAAESIHRETSGRGDLEQLERDLDSPGRSPAEIELLKRHFEGLRSIGGSGLSIESVRQAIGELSGQGSLPG
jgi:hypothetical protein